MTTVTEHWLRTVTSSIFHSTASFLTNVSLTSVVGQATKEGLQSLADQFSL